MSTSLDLTQLSLMDALDMAILIEEEAHQRYKSFASQIGRTGGDNDPGTSRGLPRSGEHLHRDRRQLRS